MTTETLTQYSDLVKTEDCYNPMFLNGKQINHLVFYDHKTGNKLLGNWEGLRWFGSNNKYPLIRFPFEFKRANKIDLSRKDAFYVSHTKSYQTRKEIALYIPISLMEEFKDLGEKMDFETDTEKHYRHDYSFNVMAKCDEYYLNENEEFKSRVTDIKYTTITFSGQYRTELKPFGQKVNAITEKVKTVYPEISSYLIEQMLTVCDITIKK